MHLEYHDSMLDYTMVYLLFALKEERFSFARYSQLQKQYVNLKTFSILGKRGKTANKI